MPNRWPLTSAQAAFSVFGDEHYRQYIHWQASIDDVDGIYYYGGDWELLRDCLDQCPQGGLPSPMVYKTFMNWLRLHGELYPPHPEPATSLAIATSCRHPLHPGNDTMAVEACPVCVMRQCIEALTRIWKAWETVGAPNRRYRAPEDEDLYHKLKALWRVEKQRWSNLIARYEELAEHEEAWEDSGMQKGKYTFEELNNAQSCRAALQAAWTMNPVKLDGHDDVFEPRQPLTRQAWKPLVRDTVTLPLSPQSSMFASPPLMPSSPPLPPDWAMIGPEKTSPALLSMEQSVSPSSSHAPLQALSPPTSPKFPLLESSEHERSSFSEYVPSEALGSTSSLPVSPPQSPLNRKKHVMFAEDVVEGEKRFSSKFFRPSAKYSRGRHACPSKDGWADTSFKNEKFFWEFGVADQDESEEEDLGTPYAQLPNKNSCGPRGRQTVLAPIHDSDSESESDSDSDSDSDTDADLSPVAVGDGEENGMRSRSPRLQSPHFARAALEKINLNSDYGPESESKSDAGSDDYEDKEAENATWVLNTGVRPMEADLHASATDRETPRAGSQVEQEPEVGDIGLCGPGRRDREVFESGSLSSIGGREVKRHCRRCA